MIKVVISSIIMAVLLNCLALAAPEPAVVAKPGDWTLEVRFEQPQQMVLPGALQQRFWYIILTLTNKSGKDVDFYPQCDLVTDTLQVIPSARGTPTSLFEKIKNRHHGKYPLLELLENAGNKLLQGEDNTRDVVVIWPDFDPNAKSVSMFISGLSNETVAVDSPTEKDPNGNPVKMCLLRKTLELRYSIAGDPKFRSDQKLKFESRQWVMR
jgi:hypothetical protein